MKLGVNEIFGPTFQGEGPSLGKRATFLRLAGCNLHCSWCDTKYTWDWAGNYGPPQDTHLNIDPHEADDVAQELWEHHPAPLLVITGGEPLLQQVGISKMISYLAMYFPRNSFIDQPPHAFQDIEIETNGTISPNDELLDLAEYGHLKFNVSPKLTNSGNEIHKRITPALEVFGRQPWARFKFVVAKSVDLLEVQFLVDEFHIDDSRVWIMPEGTDEFTLSARASGLAEEVLNRGWNMTTRLHVMLWGNRRGV